MTFVSDNDFFIFYIKCASKNAPLSPMSRISPYLTVSIEVQRNQAQPSEDCCTPLTPLSTAFHKNFKFQILQNFIRAVTSIFSNIVHQWDYGDHLHANHGLLLCSVNSQMKLLHDCLPLMVIYHFIFLSFSFVLFGTYFSLNFICSSKII